MADEDTGFKFARLDRVVHSGVSGTVTGQMESISGGGNRYCFQPDEQPEDRYWVDEDDLEPEATSIRRD